MKPKLKSISAMLLLMGSSLTASAAEPLFKAVKQPESTLDAQLSMPGEVGITQMLLNAGVLNQNTQQLELNLGKGISLVVDKQSAIVNPQGSLVWKGNNSASESVNDVAHSIKNSAVLVKRETGVTGSVRIKGKLFKIRPVSNGLHQIIQVDESLMPHDHPPGAMQILGQTANMNAATNNLNFDNIVPQESANAPDIKVLVAYTAAAKNQVSDIQGLIELAVAETNTGYSNSGVNATLTLVHTYQVNYNESSFSTDLSYFRNKNDGVMDEVHGKRDQYGADVAMIMTNISDYCGKASGIGSTSETAFAAVYHGCATGYYSFGHEVGHLLSARHNPERDPTNSPYTFGHGYQYGAGGWRTVMAYNCSPSCTRINWWSNPNKTRNGVAMGTNSRHDNARVLNLTAATMAGFKGGGTTTPPPPTTGNELTNGQAVTGLSGTQGAQFNYTLDVPSGATGLSFVMNGGSGDADMYVKFGSAPTTSSYDCRPYKNGSSETCTISNIQAGTYHVMVRGYSSFSGVSLTGTYVEESGGPGSINESNLSASQGNWNYFTIDIPAGTSSLALNISGGSGDADLYVRRGAQPTTSSYDCRPYKNANSEACSFNNPVAGTWHIGVRAYHTYSGVTLSGNWK